jgi:putative DNA methylase
MLRAGNVKPTAGDMRCIAYGHLVRLAIWNLRKVWKKNAGISRRISTVSSWLLKFGGWSEIEKHLGGMDEPFHELPLFALHENTEKYGTVHAEVSF